MTVQIPGNAINADDNDLEKPTTDLLRSLNLLPSTTDLGQAGGFAFLTGPPESVAILEAGATAASKWWATAIAGGSVVATGRIVTTWDSLGAGGPWNQPFALLAIGIILAAAALGIAYLLGSDVRGRAAGMVATIQARQAIAIAMAQQAGIAAAMDDKPGSAPAACCPIPLGGFTASNTAKPAADEAGWKAIATRDRDGKTEFLLIKADETQWVNAKHVAFD